MSLLLDALKKAAQDKIARGDGVRSDRAAVSQNRHVDRMDASKTAATPAQASELQLLQDEDLASQATIDNDTEDNAEEFEFTLDQVPENTVVVQATDAPAGDVRISKVNDDAAPASSQLHVTNDRASIAAMHATVTDEALQLLIHKSNAEHRKRQLAIWGSVISGSVIILLLAGIYFYIDMEDEIDAMQSKNRQALTALAAQTKIEDHLTSLATPVVKPNSSKPAAFKPKIAANPPATQRAKQKQAFTVQKTEIRDPINVLLDRGWTSFQREEYGIADKAYTEVLQREAHNRDALLGVAAVAGKRGETEKAREYYLKLLELDPMDAYAHAGLASIAQVEGASLSEERIKQLIEKQPDSSHLQFVLGNLYAKQGKWPQAQQAYFSAWQGDSDNADYAFNLAISLDHLKKYTEAARFYASSIDLARDRKTGFTLDTVEKRLQQLRSVNK